MGKKSMNGQLTSTIYPPSTRLEEPHLQILLAHKPIWDLYKASQEIVGFHPHIQDAVLEAFRVEHPHYSYNRNCPVCVAEFLTLAYRYYESKV
jgi:hypothetical protein